MSVSELPQRGVIITPEVMYAEQRATHDAVLVLTERIGPVLGTVTDHEKRITALEHWRLKVAGAAAVIGAIVGGISAQVINTIGG